MNHTEASHGTLLKALIMSFQAGTCLEATLGRMNEQADEGWDKLADRLQRDLAQAVSDARLRASGMDVPPRMTIVDAAQDVLKDSRHWTLIDVADRAEAGNGLAEMILAEYGVEESSCPAGCTDCHAHEDALG